MLPFHVSTFYRVDTIQNNSSHEHPDINSPRNIYGMATVTSLISIGLYTFFFVLGSTTAGKRLHDSMLTRVVGAPLTFFETRSSGESNPPSITTNLNFHPLEVVSRYCGPQLQVGENFHSHNLHNAVADLKGTRWS